MEDGRVVAGRYTLRFALGRGGMGTVWLATDGLLGREVAVKEVTFPDYLTDEDRLALRERTMREARAAARFQHPQVTTVHDVVEEGGRPWIVMEHVPSRTLAQVVQEHGPMPVEMVARIGMDLVDALHAAHRAGIVHRDVKPGNVLIDEHWRAWLTDFGIATSSGDPSITTEGVLLGSPSYMSPERARNEESGPPADLWSLGATLYTAVEGRPPFERGEPMATLLAVTTEPPAPLNAAGPLTPVLMGCLIKEPTQRMRAEQARAGMEQALGEAPVAPDAARQQPRASAADAESRELGDRVQRLDLAQLSELAASVAGRAAGKVARKAVDSASARLDRSSTRRSEPAASAPPAVTPAVTAQPQRPASARGKDTSGSERPDAGGGAPTRRRFRRRWVAVPVLVAIVLVVALVVAGLFLLSAMGDALVR